MAPKAIEKDAPSCPVSGVVVYLDRADVTREIQVDLEVGETEVIVKQLPRVIDSESIRVEGRGQATIGEVKFRKKHIAKDDETEDVAEQSGSAAAAALKELEREQERLKACLERVHTTRKRVTKQRQFLESITDQSVLAKDNKANTLQDEIAVGAEMMMKRKKKASIKVAAEVLNLHGPADAGPSLPRSGLSITDMLSEGSLETVTTYMEFYSTRTRELDERLVTIEKEESELKTQLDATRKNLELRGTTGKKAAKGTAKQRLVAITVTSEKARRVSLFLSYVVMQADWKPQYDLRVFSKDHLLKIHYFAIISQATGEDWSDAPLVLSTAQPSIGGSPPELETQKLSFHRPQPQRDAPYSEFKSSHMDAQQSLSAPGQRPRRSYGKSVQFGGDGVDDEEDYDSDGPWDEGERLAGGTVECSLSRSRPPPPDLAVCAAEVKGTVTSTAFEIPRRTTIPADRTGHKVAVAIIDLHPDFEYDTVPKYAAHAFLKAHVKNESPYALLQGPANVFLDNNFISKTSLDNVSPYELFTCSLGVDPAIRVVYKPVRRFKENAGILNKHTLVTRKQTIEIKNTRLETIKIKVTDAVPRSNDEKIKVNLMKPEVSRKETTCAVPGGKVSLTKDNLLHWIVEVAPSTQHSVEMTFTVDHPVGEVMQGLDTK